MCRKSRTSNLCLFLRRPTEKLSGLNPATRSFQTSLELHNTKISIGINTIVLAFSPFQWPKPETAKVMADGEPAKEAQN